MDRKVSGVLILVLVVLVLIGVSIYFLQKRDTTEINTPIINTNDSKNTTNNSNILQSSNQISLTLSLSNQPGSSSGPSQNITPTPEPSHTPDPTDNLISLFDAYVTSTFLKASAAGLPGSAVVVVKDGEIIYMNCLGVKDLDSGAPVTSDTLFLIGSCTKAFTATNVAQQVDKGLMNWNDTITKYYPDQSEFMLYDSDAYNNLTIADCLMHCSGLPAHAGDAEWIYFNDSYSEMLYNLRYVKNDTALGSAHEYNNIVYALSGYCAARATGTSWGDLIKKELLNPLGMDTATTNLGDYLNSSNHATCYITYNENGSTLIKPFFAPGLDEIGPAGSMGCSINQMANWLKFQLEDTGMFNGQQIVSKENLDATRTGYMYIDDKNDNMYGYGWDVDKGKISHGGDVLSSKTVVAFWPEKGVGIVILTNEGNIGQAYRDSVYRKFSDLLNGVNSIDYWPIYYETYKPQSIPDPVDYTGPGDLNSYVGVYFNDFYGNINIDLENNTLIYYYGTSNQSSTLEHWNDTTFIGRSASSDELKFEKLTNGKYQQLTLSVADFTMVPANVTSTFNRTNT